MAKQLAKMYTHAYPSKEAISEILYTIPPIYHLTRVNKFSMKFKEIYHTPKYTLKASRYTVK